MTIRDMKTTTCSCPDIHLSLSTCQWHSLKTWRHKQQKDSEDHQPHYGNGLLVPRSRHKHSTCCVGEYLYLLCGKDGTSPLKDMWRFHIKKEKWEMVELGGGTLPYLQGHTTVAYKRMMLIFGGTFTDTLGDVQLWTHNTDLGHLREMWIEPGAPQPLPRRDHSAVVYNNLMYVYGGFVDSSGACQELWAFNIDEEEWTQLTTLCRNQPGRRYGHSAVVAGNAMWLYGGMAGLSPRSDLWKYSFLLHQWKKIKVLGTPPSLSGHAACVIHGQMVVIGGNCQGKPANDVWSLTFDTCTWQKLISSGSTLLPRLSFHSCVTFCPTHAGPQQPAGMTRSTPFLKPPTTEHQLRPDLFMVRPRTSPAANSTEPPNGNQLTGPSVGSFQSQVMVMSRDREGGSYPWRSKDDKRAEEDDTCDRLDARVHVSHKEPLVSPLPEEPCFYDSCLPVSLNEKGCSPLEQEILQENASPGTDSPVTLLQQLRIMPHHRSSGMPVVSVDIAQEPDLINCSDSKSDSPVLKTSTRPRSVDIQNMFRHDLFVEDLESVEGNGLDEVKISYPSKNNIQLLPVPTSGEDIGLSDGSGNVLMQQQHNQLPTNEGFQQWQHLQPCSQFDYKNETIQLQLYKKTSSEVTCLLGDRTVLDTSQIEPYSTTGIQAHLKSEAVTQNPEQQLSWHAQLTTMYQRTSAPDQSLGQSQLRDSGRKSSVFPKSSSSSDSGSSCYEAETSFMGNFQFGQDPTSSASTTSSENGHGGTRRSPFPCNNASRNSDMTSQQWSHSKQLTEKVTRVENVHTNAPCLELPTIIRETVVDEVYGGTASSRKSHARKETEGGEPFVLVIGGRMEERGSVHTKPISMWKGVFV